MTSRWLIFAICVLGFFTTALSDGPPFPTLSQLGVEAYTTEVQVTDSFQQVTAYGVELYDNSSNSGSVHTVSAGQYRAVYYNNDTFELLEVNATTCTTWDEDDSIYSIQAIFYGWLNKNPIIVGPSAALWYAETRIKDIRYEGTETVRNFPCDKYALDIIGNLDNVTLYYYFAPQNWTTPYQMKGMRVPVRIHAKGKSSALAEKPNEFSIVDVFTDFAYFKPTIDDFSALQPPLGLGCPLRKPSQYIPELPKTFRYSAEVVDLVYADQHADLVIGYQLLWVDQAKSLIRWDNYAKTSAEQRLYDFNTGTMYKITQRFKCEMLPIRNSKFEVYDEGMAGRMKTAAEVLHLDGSFYDMGKRKIRGITCDTFESVQKDVAVDGDLYHKYVVTAYFAEDFMTIGVDGEMESQIPVAIVITGWSSPTEIAMKLQYNIFGFNDFIWPEMYSNFGLYMCFPRAESKSYFVLVLTVNPKDAAIMEDQDRLVQTELREKISIYAQVHDMRVPFLRVDYKPTGVFVTGLMLERPPALIQFFPEDYEEEVTTYDTNIKIVEAATLEDCSYSCIDEKDFTCLGFYFCGAACFLKSNDIFDRKEGAKKKNLGVCDTYARLDRDSSNTMNIRLKDALENLEKAVFNRSIDIVFRIKGGEEAVKISDIYIGDGPYDGDDAGDKSYSVNIPYRKLDSKLEASTAVPRIDMLHDCYKKCKAAGSKCATFSYCGRSKKEDKECIISSDFVVRGKTKDDALIANPDCDIFDLSFVDYFIKYPEHVSLLAGYKVKENTETLQECAKECKLEPDGKCRGFEFCKEMKACSLHTKHILDLKPEEKGAITGNNPCVHYAAKYIADYQDLGMTLLEDDSNVRNDVSLEDCAKICSEELGPKCESFNFCNKGDDISSTGSCALSAKVLADNGVTTTEKQKCKHFEKKSIVHDWANEDERRKSEPSNVNGYTKKGLTGLVIGMLALGLIIGALGFVAYSYIRSRRSGENMTVRFMKNET